MSKIAIIFGAKSFEHEISIVSSIALKKVLHDELVYIFADKNREFYHIPTNKITSKLFSSGEYKKFDKLHINNGGFYKTALFGDKKIEFDFALNVTHGGDGEDEHGEQCSECSGNGKQTCHKCDGDGKKECNECDGDGTVKCGDCDGDGQIECDECDGDGEVECHRCHGNGRHDCRECS